MYLPSIVTVINDLDTTEEMVALTISLYTLFVGITPLIWGPASDRFGRKVVICTSLSIYIMTTILCGMSWNVYYLIIFRVLQGIGLSASGVVGAGSISDVFPPRNRGFALGWYSVTALIGPIVGPVVGGVIGDLWGWRSIFYVLAGTGGIILTGVIIFLPETLNKSGPKRSLNPLVPLAFLLDPAILAIVFVSASIFGAMYLTIFVFPLQLDELYGLSELEIGMAYIPFGVGASLGTLTGGRAADLGW
eukprot:CAMPEP_0174257280 /NCGR_PEP_ID=MMETSP0439-20130205/6444_1 /TAXON_ID=0 /ORGANISM="Stereomyxa ramosa, Strain Chinc5" /LENGTH=247 /DNA_ID=CAMNT_0015340303 /DNA_START=74 /DNA_END=814 /DNA_ORIENTATION=+